MTKKGKDEYEDFYERAFTEADIDKIYEEGGSLSIHNFMEAAKTNIKDSGYAKFLRAKVVKDKTHKNWTMGGLLWDRYFKDQNVISISWTQAHTRKDGTTTLVSHNSFQVMKGQTMQVRGKTYKGGMFVPKDFYKKSQ